MKRHIYWMFWTGCVLTILFASQRLHDQLLRFHIEISNRGFIVEYVHPRDPMTVLHSEPRRVLDGIPYAPPFALLERFANDPLMARWKGWLQVPKDARYTFFVKSHGRARLWFGGDIVVDNWDDARWEKGVSGDVYLSAGYHELKLEHILGGRGTGRVLIRWGGNSMPDFPLLRARHVIKKVRQ